LRSDLGLPGHWVIVQCVSKHFSFFTTPADAGINSIEKEKVKKLEMHKENNFPLLIDCNFFMLPPGARNSIEKDNYSEKVVFSVPTGSVPGIQLKKIITTKKPQGGGGAAVPRRGDIRRSRCGAAAGGWVGEGEGECGGAAAGWHSPLPVRGRRWRMGAWGQAWTILTIRSHWTNLHYPAS